MRISIATKLIFSFFFILSLSFLPAYWYLKRDLHSRVMEGVEIDLDRHAQMVVHRLGPLSDAQQGSAAREIAAILSDRVTIVGVDGRVLGESTVAPAALSQVENHTDRQEIQQALRTGVGRAIRMSPTKGEPYLYVARLLRAPDGKPHAVVRLSRPIGAVTHSFRGAVTFLYRAAGVAASLVLVMSLAATLYTVRPLLRLREAAQAYARGEFTFPLPAPTRDEIGDLNESMAELARRIQQERVHHSADGALLTELVRALPVPVLLLGPDRTPQEVNAAFREAADIDPAHEYIRVHQLSHSPEFEAAAEAARRTLSPQPLPLSLPWRRGTLRVRLSALPAPAGQASFVLLGDNDSGDSAAARRGLRRAERLLGELSALESSSPAAMMRLCELRVLIGALQPATVPLPESVTALELLPLLQRLMAELLPVAAAQGSRIDLAETAPLPAVADSEGRVERVLRAALFRSLIDDRRRQASRPPAPIQGAPETALELSVHPDKTVLRLQIAGLQRAVPITDLDQILSPLGSGVGPSKEAAAGGLGDNAAAGTELWIQLRLA